MKKIIIIIACILILGLIAGSCSSSSSSDYDNVMASQDWGPDHYYNSGSHRVEKKVHLF